MPSKSLDSYGSYMVTPDVYYNSGSGTLTLKVGHDSDAQDRIANYQLNTSYLTETQTTATNNLCDNFAAQLGGRFRWYVRVRGTGSIRMYNKGVALGSTVTFNTSGLWYLVDTGLITQMGFGDYLSPRVWGASSIDVGLIYCVHRAMVYDFTSVLIASPPHTTVVPDPGTIGANAAKYLVAPSIPYTPDKIASLVPGVAEGITPLFVGRIDNDIQAAGLDVSNTEYYTAADKNGVQIGHHSITSNALGGTNNNAVTPSVKYLNEGGDGITPSANGAATFTATDTLNIYAAPSTGAAGKGILFDQLLLSRDCANVLLNANNTGAAASFAYSWTDFGTATAVQYDIIVTDQTGNLFLGNGTIQQTLLNVTSPTTVSGMVSDTRVYVRAVLADGDWNCWSVDQFTAPDAAFTPQMIRYG